MITLPLVEGVEVIGSISLDDKYESILKDMIFQSSLNGTSSHLALSPVAHIDNKIAKLLEIKVRMTHD